MARRITIHEEDYPRLLEMEKEDAGLVLQNLIRTLNGEPVEIKGDAYVDYFSEVACMKMMRFVELSERQAEKGRKGGGQFGNTNAKRTENEPKTNQKRTETNPNTNTNTNTITNIYDAQVSEILKYLNEKAGTRYHVSKESCRFIIGRLKDGFTVEDFRAVIDKKTKEWKGTEMAAFIRPSTLFAPSHFEEYLNQPEKKGKASQFTEGATDAAYNFSDLEAKLVKN